MTVKSGVHVSNLHRVPVRGSAGVLQMKKRKQEAHSSNGRP